MVHLAFAPLGVASVRLEREERGFRRVAALRQKQPRRQPDVGSGCDLNSFNADAGRGHSTQYGDSRRYRGAVKAEEAFERHRLLLRRGSLVQSERRGAAEGSDNVSALGDMKSS